MTALGNREAEAESGAAAASELRLLIRQVDGAKWRAVAGESVPVLRREVGRHFAELAHRVGELRKNGAGNRGLTDALRQYRLGVTRELDVLQRGSTQAARQIDEQIVDPAFTKVEALGARAQHTAEMHAAEIRTDRNRFEIGIVLLGFGMVAGIIFFISRSYRRVRERDLTDRQQRRFRSLVESSHDVISTVDDDEVITFVSPNLASVFPLITTSTLPLTDVLRADALEVWRDAHANLRRTAKAVTCEITVPGDDQPRTLETVGTPLDAEFGSTAWIWRDVTERRELEDQLAHQAFHDPLTGLANRALLQNRIEHVLTGARRSGRSAVLLLMDLDGFKAVNDELGHATGDALLTVIAGRLTECSRAGETVARLGGDEFAILIEDRLEAAIALSERILEVAPQEVRFGDSRIYPRLSIGLAAATNDSSVEELMRHADIAMYDAKNNGRACSSIYTEALDHDGDDRLAVLADLEHAIEQDQFELHYQQTVRLPDGEVDGFEALVRWRHPVRGLVAPDAFIPVAEANGQIIPIGRWVLQQACRDAVRLQSAAPDPVVMHVNVSVHQLRDHRFIDHVFAALAASGLDARLLVLEVTEGVLLDNQPAVQRLQVLRDHGVRIAVDDFGTGYTSINYLRSLPLDILKIDRCFVSGDTVPEREREALLTGILGLAHGLSLHCVAEGIETDEQCAQLTRLGCEDGQGFLFARPQPVADVIAQLETRATSVPMNHQSGTNLVS